MNKLLVALGLAATVALVGCNKEKAPETGATAGQHLENAATQAGQDLQNAASDAANATATAVDNTAAATVNAADHVANAADHAATATVDAAKTETATAAGAVEKGASDVKEAAKYYFLAFYFLFIQNKKRQIFMICLF